MPEYKKNVKQISIGSLTAQDNDAINKMSFKLAMIRGGMLSRNDAIRSAIYILASDDPIGLMDKLKEARWNEWNHIIKASIPDPDSEQTDDTDW